MLTELTTELAGAPGEPAAPALALAVPPALRIGRAARGLQGWLLSGLAITAAAVWAADAITLIVHLG